MVINGVNAASRQVPVRTPRHAAAACETGSLARTRTCPMTSLLLGLVTTATIVGNVFVMVAIGVERHLRVNVANYLIASLAVADLLVAALVITRQHQEPSWWLPQQEGPSMFLVAASTPMTSWWLRQYEEPPSGCVNTNSLSMWLPGPTAG